MKLLAGLGNPGSTYQNHRHNVGFQFCDFFVEKINSGFQNNKNAEINFEQNKKFRAEIVELNSEKNKFIVIKPQTYMNASGESVKKVKNFYKIIPADIIIVHDELDIPLGKFKIQHGGGSKIHNGLRSLEEELAGRNFWMIRIGIENRDPNNRLPGEAFVLQNFTTEEKELIDKTFEDIYKRLQELQLL